ncbi:MAG: hypothetical protein ACK5WB_10505 [Phycisphaerales bacterium]|jgi:hypothetical protein|nr:hypothetical protein [Phycisphaeraceae bacterium]
MSQTNQPPSPIEAYFCERRPSSLVVEGLTLLLVAALAMFITGGVLGASLHSKGPGGPSLSFLLLASAVQNVLLFSGVVIVAVGCVRFISDAIRDAAANRPPPTPGSARGSGRSPDDTPPPTQP